MYPPGAHMDGHAQSIHASTEQLLDAAPDGMVITDADGVIRLVNRQAEALFGYRRDELVGRPVELLMPERVRQQHPDHRKGYLAGPAARPMGLGLELSARRKDGSEFPVDISLSSLETENGLLVSAAVRDLTERKRIDDERAQLREQLLRAQQEEERAHLEAKLHQTQRLESLGQLAGGIAHDFNNLLAGIMSYAALVARTLEKKAPPGEPLTSEVLADVKKDVTEITQISKRAADLVHQLLVLGRREVVNPEVLDLNQVIAGMEQVLRRTLGEERELVTELHPELPRTKGDRAQLEQVLLNLVANARDAMPQGGWLEVKTEPFDTDPPYARTRSIAHGRYVRLTVSDTGSGMPPEVVQRAFEPFFTTKPKGMASGLGLTTIYSIVTRAGGDVVLYSDQGMGTSVRVVLPATDEPVARQRPSDEHLPEAHPAATILLVEDEDIVRIPAERTLTGQGYDVLSASNATAALELLDGHVVDLLLTDVVMPGPSGKELADEVARLSPETKVLFMSGYSAGVITQQGVLEPGVDLLEKPFTGESLLRRVLEVLTT